MARLLVLLVTLLLLASCGGGDGDSDSGGDGGNTIGATSISAFAIADARAIWIGPGDAATGVLSVDSVVSDRLFKVTKTGFVEEVTATDSEGNVVTTLSTPTEIHNVNDEVLVISFSSTHYLVRRNDGAAFKLDVEPRLANGDSFRNRSMFRTDAIGNLYYPSSTDTQAIFKVSGLLTDGDPTSARVTPELDDVLRYDVADDGYFGYIARTQSRIVSPSGGLFNISPDTAAIWTGPDGKLYFNDDLMIMRVDIAQDGAISVVEYADLSLTSVNPGSWSGSIYEVSGRLLLVGELGVGPWAWELYNESGQLGLIEDIPLTSVKASTASNTHLYLAGTDEFSQPRLLIVNPVSGSIEDLLTPNTYDVYEIAVSTSGIVTFGGLRMSDGARVLGDIDVQGNLVILNESLSKNISTLVRVN